MRKSKLNVGDKFGHLTLVKQMSNKNKHGSYLWECCCDCGKTKIVPSSKVRRGDSCGCAQEAAIEKRSLVGKRYGRLFVSQKIKQSDNVVVYLCECDCGNEKLLGSHDLRGGTKSCGCLAKEMRLVKLPYGESSFNHLYCEYNCRAKKKNIFFDISKDDFRQLTQQNCHYCGSPPNQITRIPNGNGEYVFNGLDRLTPNLGYTITNCVPCCGTCNWMKLDMSKEEFFAHLRLILQHQDIV